MPIRAILFDLDGTLIDQFEAIHRAFARVLTQMGYPEPSYEKVKSSVGGASLSTMTKLIGPERAHEAVEILRPIFEEEMLLGLKALPDPTKFFLFAGDAGSRLPFSPTNTVRMPGQHAIICFSRNGFLSLLGPTIRNGKARPKTHHARFGKIGWPHP